MNIFQKSVTKRVYVQKKGKCTIIIASCCINYITVGQNISCGNVILQENQIRLLGIDSLSRVLVTVR